MPDYKYTLNLSTPQTLQNIIPKFSSSFLWLTSKSTAKDDNEQSQALQKARKLAPLPQAGSPPNVGPRQQGRGYPLAACATGGSAARDSKEKRSADYPRCGTRRRRIGKPCASTSSYPSRSTYVSPTRSLSLSPVPRSELH